MNNTNHFATLGAGGGSQQLALTVASAATAAAVGGTPRSGGGVAVIVTVTTPSFIRAGAAPTVATDGTDLYLAANLPYRLDGMAATDKLALAALTGTGTAYITPVV